jgi:hypothetical protein
MLSGVGYRMGEGGESADRKVRRWENLVRLRQVRDPEGLDQGKAKSSLTLVKHGKAIPH